MKINKQVCLLIAFATLISANLTSQAQGPAKILESFEEVIPAGLSATGRNLSIDNKRMKHGAQSLKWDWKGNDKIIFNTPVGYHKQEYINNTEKLNDGHGGSEKNPVLEPPRGFFVFVYNTKASPQRIRVQFGRQEKIDCEFDFNLNFTGWRSISIAYDRGDMRGVPHKDMNRITINAPATGSGTFYFDMLGTSVTMNPRTVGPNPQLPEIDQHPRLVAQYPHLLYAYSKKKPTFNLESLTNNIVNDFRIIENNVKDIYWPAYNKSKNSDSKIKGIKEKYNKFEIKREDYNIYGRPLIYTHLINDHFSELQLSKEEKFKGLMRWRYEFNYLLRDISNLHYYTSNTRLKAELEEMFINLFDYGIDQGFDVGAGLGWIHHYSYNIREYAPAIYIMRDVLKKHKRLEKAHEICRWFYSFNMVYDEQEVYGYEDRVSANADEIQGLVMPRLLTALMQDDSPEKARDLKHFSSYFSNITTGYANALDETFKPDGVVFHHAGHAFGYGGRAINGAVCTMYMLSGTSFAATPESYNRMKKVVKTYTHQMFTDNVMAPKAFASIRFSNYELPKQFFTIPAILAMSASKPDTEMAQLFSDLLSKSDSKSPDFIFWENKLANTENATSEYNYSYCQIYPYSCVGVNRHKNDYLITARGHSKYVYPFESWGKSFFAFPLFIANGYLDVSYPNSLDALTPAKGTWYKGYNWHRWPGATTVNLPYEDMETNPGQVRDEGGEYLFSDQAFCGGVSTTYNCGVFAFQFKGHDKFNLQSFTGKKTYFFVDDKVICLGSNIQSDVNLDVETTLFQTHLEETSEPTILNNTEISNFPYSENVSTKEPAWMIDNRKTGYYILNTGKNASLKLERVVQDNPNSHNAGQVSGNFATAYINHGKLPKEASYKYILMANATTEKMKALEMEMLNKQKPYEVIQSDSIAHILALNNKQVTAYAIYAKNGTTIPSGLITKVNKQATFMAKTEGKKLRLSVADPDINIYDGQDDLLPDGTRTELSVYEREWFFWPSRSNKIQLTIKGKWAIDNQIVEMETAKEKKAKIISANKKQSVIEFECRDGLSAEVLLKRL